MTEAHAFRDDLPGDRPDGEEPWPDTVSSANAVVQHDAPVPARTAPAGLVAEDGTRLAAGLGWETASGPERPALRRDAPPVLRLPTRRARLADADGGPCGSLLLQMAADLATVFFPAASGPWVFIAELPEPEGAPTLWMALADMAAPDEDGDGPSVGEGVAARVTPRPGPELTFDDADDALDALQEHLAITDIAGIAVRWRPIEPDMTSADSHRGPMIAGIAALAEAIELHDVGPDTPAPLGTDRDAAGAAAGVLPLFVPPRRVPVRLLGGIGAGAGAILAGIFVVVPMIEEALRPPPPPPPKTVSVQVAPGAFAAACIEALDAWWPRITGWRVGSSGCAMAGHLPERPALPEPQATGRMDRPMAVWRHLVPESGRNIVLARSAAEQMLATWPHESSLEEESLTLWSTASLPLAPAEGGGEREDVPDAQRIRDRLAALWADSPGAVTVLGEGRGEDLVQIATSGDLPADTALSRAARVAGIVPVRLVRLASGDGELVIAPATFRELPAELFETDGGESS